MGQAPPLVIFNALVMRGRRSGVEWAVWQRAQELRAGRAPVRYLVAKGVDIGVPEERCVRLPSFAGTRIGRILCELFILPFMFRGLSREAVFISPAYVAPPFLPCRSILYVYDLHVFTHPRLCSLANVLHYRLRIPWSIRRADVIEVPSKYVAGIVAGRFPGAAAKVRVRPLSLRPPFLNSSPVVGTSTVAPHHPYLLFVGHPGKRKNLPLAIEAWCLLREKLGMELAFVVAGAKDGWKAPEGVTNLGYVPDHEMPTLYAGALALVYPSVDEGFGLPLIEAAACSCPAIACCEVAREVAPGTVVCAPDANAIADALAGTLAVNRGADGEMGCGAPRSPRP